MQIILDKTGKKFQTHWVFKDLNFQFEEGIFYALTGPNGSGKSTLIKMLSGYLTPTAGGVKFIHNHEEITPEDLYPHFSLAAPFCTLMEDLSLREVLTFHMRFKPFFEDLTVQDIINEHGYPTFADQALRNFSSGMLQRVKLLLAFCSDTNFILLDEPTSFLDNSGKDWFRKLINKYHNNKRLIIMATNSNFEKDLAEEVFNLSSSPHVNNHA